MALQKADSRSLPYYLCVSWLEGHGISRYQGFLDKLPWVIISLCERQMHDPKERRQLQNGQIPGSHPAFRGLVNQSGIIDVSKSSFYKPRQRMCIKNYTSLYSYPKSSKLSMLIKCGNLRHWNIIWLSNIEDLTPVNGVIHYILWPS